MKLAILVLLLMLAANGCRMPFSRPVPTPTQYKEKFLSFLEPDDVSDLQYSYQGAVGGEASIAKFRLTQEAIGMLRTARPIAVTFKPADQDEIADLKREFANLSGAGRIPKWFDFPFDKSLLLFEESGDNTDECPSFSHKWFVDEDLGIVYFAMVEG